MTINAAVLGVSGYTGQALVKLLLTHPVFKLTALFSTSIKTDYKKHVPEFAFADIPEVTAFDIDRCADLDVIFLAVPHTKSMAMVARLMAAHPRLKIIDLSADFRIQDRQLYEDNYGVSHDCPHLISDAVYGLPEKYKAQLSSARLCANPGCYATSMILGVLPLLSQFEGHYPITIDAKSGVSGAGRALKESSLFCEVQNQLSAYSTGTHRHIAELGQETGLTNVLFSPHLIPMERGIESAIYIHLPDISQTKLSQLYEDFYSREPFVTVYDSDTSPTTRLVNHTNQCAIIPKKQGEFVVVFSLIDNLIKGASGQAIQNANIMCDIDETHGLL